MAAKSCRVCEEHPEQLHHCSLANNYEVSYKGIRSPGKFEGECRYMPYFYSVMLNVCGDEQPDGVISIPVEKEDREIYPELMSRKRVRFYERDDGLVCQVH